MNFSRRNSCFDLEAEQLQDVPTHVRDYYPEDGPGGQIKALVIQFIRMSSVKLQVIVVHSFGDCCYKPRGLAYIYWHREETDHFIQKNKICCTLVRIERE